MIARPTAGKFMAKIKRNGWPKKAREIQTAIVDSTRWNGFKFRADDVVIDTFGKSGTTWMQQIVGQLVLDAPDGVSAADASPWLDMRIFPLDETLAALEAQKHRRFIKTHLPVDALVFSPRAKYIYVGRDARDIVWSAYNHQAGFTQEALDAFNETPGRVGPRITHPPCDVRDYYLHFLEYDDFPGFEFGGLWEHTQGWWNIRHLPNVLLVHFNDLKADMEREIRRIARFLGIEVPESKWPRILEHCSFDYMRAAAAKVEVLDKFFKGGGATFIHKGTNGRWKDVLSSAEIARCDAVAARHLTPDCVLWLRTGKLVSKRAKAKRPHPARRPTAAKGAARGSSRSSRPTARPRPRTSAL
jgi:aryl sulfotransferase